MMHIPDIDSIPDCHVLDRHKFLEIMAKLSVIQYQANVLNCQPISGQGIGFRFNIQMVLSQWCHPRQGTLRLRCPFFLQTGW